MSQFNLVGLERYIKEFWVGVIQIERGGRGRMLRGHENENVTLCNVIFPVAVQVQIRSALNEHIRPSSNIFILGRILRINFSL